LISYFFTVTYWLWVRLENAKLFRNKDLAF